MTTAGKGGADPSPLPPRFYDRGAGEAARDLLGALVVSGIGGARCVCEIVETEAYTGPDDEASHAHIRFGKTARNAAMFGPPGIAYVYRIYGMHWCLNVVTGPEDFPAAILIRAARPTEGLDAMRARRPGRPDRDLLRGPGNLCRALAVTGEHNFHPVQSAPLWLAPGAPVPGADVVAGPRIGITRAADAPLRFRVRGDPYVSR
ncbi:MAG TPA: DNA-3-methyladenine glycosylase [Longimicrobiaceae bacterium]|nr:DNA-3-methyladenine glycosylase [Longimicrobiaceae bacterium]